MSPRTFVSRTAALLALVALGAACETKTIVTPVPTGGKTPVGVVVSPQSATLTTVGQTAQFVALVTGGDSTTARSVTWSSSNTAVATVDANGVAKAVANGTATIIGASTADPTAKGAALVTVNITTTGGGTTTPPTVSISGIFAGNTFTPANLSGAFGTLIVQASADVPAGTSVAAINFNFDSKTVCSQTMTQGKSTTGDVVAQAANAVTFTCQIKSDSISGGQPVYPNGAHTVTVSLVDATGKQLASASQALTLNNTSNIGLAVSTTKGPAINQVTGLSWNGGDLTVTANPSLFGGSPIAQVTITVKPYNSAALTKTLTAAPFTTTFSASADMAHGGISDLQDSVRISVSGVTTAGQAFTGTTSVARLGIDNVAPTISQLNIPANGWVNGAFNFNSQQNPTNVAFTDGGVDNVVVTYFVGPTVSTATTQVNSGADIAEGTPVILKAVATDALGNTATYYAVPGGAPTTNSASAAITTFQVDKIAPVITFPSGVGNPSNKGAYKVQKTFTFAIADSGQFSSQFNPNPDSVRQVLITPTSYSCVAPSTPDPNTGLCTFQQNTGLTVASAATSGYDSLFAYVTDRAGNQSATISRTILIDNVSPTIGGLSFPAVSTGGTAVQLSAPATDNIAVSSAYPTATYTGATGYTLRYPGTTLASFGQFNTTATATGTIDFLIRNLQESNVIAGGVSPGTFNPLTGYGLNISDLAGNTAANNAGGLTAGQVPQAVGGFDFSTVIHTFIETNNPNVICYASSGTAGAACPAGVPSSTTLQVAAAGTGSFNNQFSKVAFFRLSSGVWRFIGYASTATASADNAGNYTWTYALPYSPGAQTFTNGTSTVWTIMAIGVNANGDGLTSSQSTLTINEQ